MAKSILAVDDSGSLRQMVVFSLKAAGYLVTEAVDGQDGLDKARALQCLSMAVYYEAASESYAGQQAVAQVGLHRCAHPSYPAPSLVHL